MKTLLKSALCAAVGLLLAANSQAQDNNVDPAGKWSYTTPGRDGATRTNSFTFKLVDGKLTGTVSGRQRETPIEEVMLKGDEISFKVTREFNGNQMVSKYAAKIAGDTMKGRWSTDRGGQVREREFEANREKTAKE